MDRTQVAATLAGLALVGASVFGAVVVTQGSGDASLATTPAMQSDTVAVSAQPVTVVYAEQASATDQVTDSYADDTTSQADIVEYREDEYSEDEYEHDQYEDDHDEEDDEDDD